MKKWTPVTWSLLTACLVLAGPTAAAPVRASSAPTAEMPADVRAESLAQGGEVLPVDRLESPPVGPEGMTLRPIDVGHAELCGPEASGDDCHQWELYDEVFRISATELPGGPGETRLTFHAHPGIQQGFILLGRDARDRIRLAGEFRPAQGSANPRAGRVDAATAGRPAILWVTYGSGCGGGQACGYTRWVPFTFVYEDGRHRLAPAGPISTNALHRSRVEGDVLACTEVQGGPEPRANPDGSFTVTDLLPEGGELVEQTLTWSRDTRQLVVSATSAPRPAPLEGDCTPP
jgi:hypothetical protein